MEAIHIRPATIDDFEYVYQFINTLEGQVFDRSAQWEIYVANASNANNIYLMAWAHALPVGYLSCHAQHLLHHGGLVGEIQEMFVTENGRGRGIGKLLLDRCKEIAKANGVLQLEVTSGLMREDAHRFYEREGFLFTHKKFSFAL
ncbi:N-acetyltransferase domain-containing protein [Flavobacterium longum]|uniref:GNAT family N-acetyltransferase n=1 Tax=Flavobacterium longum TaxID=1299340 RepID=UPI0039EADF51